GDDHADNLAATRLGERPAERRDLGADPGEAAVRRRLAVDPDGAGHQMILRSARNATTVRPASAAGAPTTRVAARAGGASAPRAAGLRPGSGRAPPLPRRPRHGPRGRRAPASRPSSSGRP